MKMKDKLIFLGVISAAHGIKGEVLIKTFNADPKKLADMEIIDKDENIIKLEFVRDYHKGGIIAIIDGCNSRNDAEKFIKTALYCKRSSLPKTTTEEFYINDLIGLRVIDIEFQEMGVVTGVFNFGAGDIIEIKFFKNNQQEMFPFTKEIFPEIKEDTIVFLPEQK